jgi:hypothetical protein
MTSEVVAIVAIAGFVAMAIVGMVVGVPFRSKLGPDGFRLDAGRRKPSDDR